MRNQRLQNPWAVGFIFYAGIMLIMTGVFGALQGLAAIIKDSFYVVSPNYLFEFDVTVWGWIHLFLGVLVGLAGVAVIRGQAWGRFVGIALVAVSLIVNFMFLPHYPSWAIVTIALDAAIIWALAVYREGAV